MSKSTNMEAQQKVDQIIDLLISGISEHKIATYCIEKLNWNLHDCQIRKYKKRAVAHLRKLADFDKKEQIGKALKRYEKAVTIAIKANSAKQVVVAQKAISELFGLNAPTKHEVTGKDGGKIEIDNSDAKAAEVLRILFESGAIKSTAEGINDSKAE